MRPSFEKQLRTYSGIAKEEHRLKEEGQTDERLAHVLDWHMEQAADVSATNIETQKDIVELQRTKQEVMRRLRMRLKDIDRNTPETGEERRPVEYVDGEYVYHDGKGERLRMTLGELLTDGEWGLTYRLDPETVPRETRKRYAIEEAKQELQDFLDLQITLQESASSRTEAGKRGGYSEMFKTKKAELEEGYIESGFIAERLVRNILRKLSIDHEADFSITRTDAYQDMEHKIDFVIRRKQTERGVNVREDEHAIGIQFTTDSRPKTITRKERQIAKAKTSLEPGDRIQDIVLVVLPLKHSRRLYEGWRVEGSLPGGPDALWLAETKRKILRGLLKGFVSDEDIERYCGLVKEKETNPFRKTETA